MSVDIKHFTLIGGPFHGTVAHGVDPAWKYVMVPTPLNGGGDVYTHRDIDGEVCFVHEAVGDAVAKILKKASGSR